MTACSLSVRVVVCLCVLRVFAGLCSTSPPGGNQVDGLPPASTLLSGPVHDILVVEDLFDEN